MSGFDFLFRGYLLNLDTNPITNLWANDKDAATEKYFPEYAEVHGGNPPNILIQYFDLIAIDFPILKSPVFDM